MPIIYTLLELWCIHEYDKELDEERRELEQQDEENTDDEDDAS